MTSTVATQALQISPEVQAVIEKSVSESVSSIAQSLAKAVDDCLVEYQRQSIH